MTIYDFDTQLKASSKQFSSRVYIKCPNRLRDFTFEDIEIFKEKFNTYLIKKKISQKDKVCTIIDNSKLLICLFLSVIGNNRVLVPINPSSGDKEMEYILKKTKPKLIIGDHYSLNKIKKFQNFKKEVVKNEEKFINYIFSQEKSLFKPKTNIKKNIAEILFTSGSTGNPKGVVLTHKNILTNTKGIIESLQFEKKYSNFLSVTPLYHNNGQFIPTLIPLILGHSTTTIKPLTGLLNFVQVLKKVRIHYTSVMATHINYLCSLNSKFKLHNLREIYCGGAKLDFDIQKKFEKRFKVKILANYGLTETSSIASTESSKTRKLGSVGKPLKNLKIKISKNKKNFGEILIKGKNIFKCYLNNSKLTNEKIIKSYLHTGDKGFFDKNGYLFIQDRIDNMINVSGENIYPYEVERYTNNFDGIKLSVAIGIKDEITQNKIILIYEKTTNQIKLDEDKVDKVLSKNISLYKIPKKYFSCEQVGLKEIPKASNQKILRKKLKNYLDDFFKKSKMDL